MSARVRERLAQLRRERNLTLDALSAKMKDLGRPLLPSAISKIEKGDRRVDVDDLVAFALAFDVSPNAILLSSEARPDIRLALTPAYETDAETAWQLAIRDAPQGLGTDWDFFLSYAQEDRRWAEWIAWQLEHAGYRVLVQAWDFVPGSNWMTSMTRGTISSARVIAVLSKAYIASSYGRTEWEAAARADPSGFARKLLPIRVEDCPRPGILAQIVSIDLFGLDVDAARMRLLDTIAAIRSGRAKPALEPSWPAPDGTVRPLPGVDTRQVRHSADVARGMLPTLPEGDPRRIPFQVMVTLVDGLDAFMSGRWTPDLDQLLADLDQAAAAGTSLGPDMAEMIFGVTAMSRAIRCYTRDQSPQAADRPTLAEFDEVIAELESTADRLREASPILHGLDGPLRGFADLLLALRADVPDGGSGKPDGDTAERLARARAHLAAASSTVLREDDLKALLATLSLLEQGDRTEIQDLNDISRSAQIHQEWFDADGGNIPRANALSERARQTRSPEDLATAISALRTARRSLPAGHPQHADLLTMLTHLLGLRATLTQSPEDMADAIDAGIEAVRAATPPSLATAGHLVGVLTLAIMLDLRVSPFEQAEAALTHALAATAPGETSLRLSLTVGIGAARAGRWRVSRIEHLRHLAREALDEAERMLPEPTPADQWLAPAWLLFMTNISVSVIADDPAAGAAAARLADKLDQFLVTHPDLAERAAGQTVPGGLAALAQSSDGAGLLQMLRLMKQVLPLAMLQDDPAAMRATMHAAMGVPVTPSPPPASQTRRLAARGLDRAAHALGTDRAPVSRRRPLAPAGRPEPAALHGAVEDLRASLAGGLDDSSLRNRVHSTLGLCLAELYWLGQTDRSGASAGRDADIAAEPDGQVDRQRAELARTLADAIDHLDRSIASGEHALPTVERADLLDVLSRCYRESARTGQRSDARHDAERTARAAIRELARCVLLADDTDAALGVAARSNDVVARAVGWCLADGRPRAAVEVAESGRSLVLASIVLAGQVEDMLRGEGKDAAADGWRTGDAEGRLAGLAAISASLKGQFLLTTPTADAVSMTLLATGMDAVVYLVPPVPPDHPAGPVPPSADAAGAPGHALLVRPEFQVDVLRLPAIKIGAGSPLADYLAAFHAALATHDPTRRHPDGFRGTAAGQAWASALDDLGAWTYHHIVGPLIEHTRDWLHDRAPHLALVPLGELGAIPCAIAWTEDPEIPDGRRYSVHDLMITQIVSARLLAEVARRPRLQLQERVVRISDPTGEFPYARATATALDRSLYPNAEVYGRTSAQNGPATTDALLAALPGRGENEASLLHLATHATTESTARLKTSDGWLPLARVLDQARARPPDAPGGLVITSACLTDNTRSHYDESLILATALLAAGATAVVGTRWPIGDDDSTATFTYHLHHHLAAGHPPADALRLAQLDMLDPEASRRPGLHPHLAALPYPRLAHPASWAGYVHHGM